MKKNLLILLLILATAGAGLSQKKNLTSAIMMAKGSRTKAPNYLKAKPFIDKATAHESTKTKAKAWYWKARIYAGLATSKKEDAIKIAETTDLGAEVFEAMANTKKFDKQNEYKSKLQKLAIPMYTQSVNAGINAYNSKKYEQAFKAFTSSQSYASLIGITDSTGAYYGGRSAHLLKDYDNALASYKKCTEINFGGVDPYIFMAEIYKGQEKPEEAKKIMAAAKEKFPTDPNIILEEVKDLLLNKKPELAKEALEKALENDPNNYSMQYAAGITYNDMELYDKAIESYEKALEIQPNNYNSQYNLCVVYNNVVSEKYKALNEISISETAKYDKAKAEMRAYINEKLPFVMEVYKIEDEPALKRILNNFYRLTGQNDKRIK